MFSIFKIKLFTYTCSTEDLICKACLFLTENIEGLDIRMVTPLGSLGYDAGVLCNPYGVKHVQTENKLMMCNCSGV